MIEDFDSDLRHAVTRVDDHSLTFFGALQTARHARGGFEERLRIGPGWFGDVLDDGLGLIAALGGLDDAMRKKAGSDEAGAQVNEDAATLARRAAELRDHLTFLLEAANPSFVYFLETRNRGVFLRAAPIDVSHIINEMLFNRMRATIMTSATLTVAGSFDYVKGRLGVSDADCVRVQSEFDFSEQAILYLPSRCRRPNRHSTARPWPGKSATLLIRTEGRAFVLFTSYAMLRTVRDLVEPDLPYPVIVQGTAPAARCSRNSDRPRTRCCLPPRPFWQGVDVVGEQLSCVIIDKLPFASPGDPITAARIEAINAEGGDAFQDYQVPLAILAMLQGLGRLIRHRTDRGVLAVLDPRLRTMAYGRRFLDSFPPAPVTQNPRRSHAFSQADLH
jgi:ATP-dependent DNA helicase DinG